MTVLALKLTLAPALVVAATLAGRRWGAAVAGILMAIPVIAAPILAILVIEQGREFGSVAVRSALLGIVALAAFCAAFARVAAAGRPWPAALLSGWLAYALMAAVLSRLDAPAAVGVVAALAGIAVAAWLIGPRPRRVMSGPPPWWDLPARAGLTALMVLTVTGLADAVGPAVSGVLTPFPVAMSVLSPFVLAQDGPDAAVSLSHGFVRTLPAFALSFFAVALLL